MEWFKKQFSEGILEISANSWRGFVEYVEDELYNYRVCIYRGQREPWGLLSKMDRVLRQEKNVSNKQSTRRVLRQANVLQEFKQACRGRRGPFSPELAENEWWALGRHYGLETPLLDWTESPFVAAFFAFEDPREKENLPRMVYAIQRKKIEEKSNNIKKEKPGTLLTGTEAIEIVSPQVDDNSRLVSQRGLFTKCLCLDLEIEDWVRKYFHETDDAIMIKIAITENPGDREVFLKFLNRMNINHLTLFTDLDGAARYCNMQLEIDGY